MANVHAKFEVSSFYRCRDMERSQFQNRSRNTFMTLFDLILHFFSLGPPVVNLFAKFGVSNFNRSRDVEVSQNSLSHSLTDRHTN